MLARRARRRAEVARRHRRGADVGRRRPAPRPAWRRCARRASTSIAPLATLIASVALQHVGAARRDQHQVGEAHHLHRARRGADVAGMAGADQDEAGADRQGRWRVAAKIAGRSFGSRAVAGPLVRRALRLQRPHCPCRKRCTPCSTPPSRRRAPPARSSTAPRSTSSGCRSAPRRPNDFVTEVDHAARGARSSRRCSRAYPGHGILAEESGSDARRQGQRLRLDHRSARRHHQLHPRLADLRGVDRAGVPRPGRSRPSSTTRRATTCSTPPRAAAPSSTTGACASRKRIAPGRVR